MKRTTIVLSAVAGSLLLTAPAALATDPTPLQAEQPAGDTMRLTVVLADGGG